MGGISAPVSGALLPLVSIFPTSSPVSVRRANAIFCTCTATGAVILAGRVFSISWAPAVSVAGAAVWVPRHKATSHCRVLVGPVVCGVVEGVVGQPRAYSHVWKLIALVDGARLAPEVRDVGLGFRPAHGGR